MKGAYILLQNRCMFTFCEFWVIVWCGHVQTEFGHFVVFLIMFFDPRATWDHLVTFLEHFAVVFIVENCTNDYEATLEYVSAFSNN